MSMNSDTVKNMVLESLNLIKSLGDCKVTSGKHIEHGLIALIEGLGVLNSLDYEKPEANISKENWIVCTQSWETIGGVFAIYGTEFILDCYKIFASGRNLKESYAYEIFKQADGFNYPKSSSKE